tara:strand:+ start:708 stop:887 length:180 start_codon:yes stop_codon:yes gene_type:complete
MDLKKGLSALVLSSCLLATSGCKAVGESRKWNGEFAKLGYEVSEVEKGDYVEEKYSVEE